MGPTQQSLFEDFPAARTRWRSAAPRTDRRITLAQQQRSKLAGELEQLRQRLIDETRRLDETLARFAEQIEPRRKQLSSARKSLVRRLAQIRLGRVKRRDRAALDEIISEQFDAILAEDGSIEEIDLRALFQRLRGERHKAEALEESAPMDTGVEGGDGQDAAASPERESSIASIYGQLSKAFDPAPDPAFDANVQDDPAKTQQNVALMQELERARGRKDLPALIRLELDWIRRQDGTDRLDHEKLALCNEILRAQLTDLGRVVGALLLQSEDLSAAGCNESRNAAALDARIRAIEASAARLQSPEASEELQSMIREHRAARRGPKNPPPANTEAPAPAGEDSEASVA